MLQMLLLLLLVVQIVPQVESLYSIDWKRCNVDAICFVDGKCDKSLSKDSKYYYSLQHFSKSEDELVNNQCNIGVQLIAFTTEKVLIYIQVIGVELNNELIGLYQKDELLVGCKMKNGNITVIHHPDLTKKKMPVLYETFSHFEKNRTLCAVTIDRFNKFFVNEFLKKPPFADADKTILIFEPVNPEQRPAAIPNILPPGHFGFTHAHQQNLFTVGSSVTTCDPIMIKPPPHRPEFHVLPIKDIARRKLDCANYKNELGVGYDYKIFIQQGENHTELDELECDSTHMFKGKSGNVDIEIEDQADFSAYCAVKISKTCKDTFICTSNQPMYCPKFYYGTADESAKIECPGKKWLIDDEYYEGDQPECKDDEILQNHASFYMNTGAVSKLKKGECFREYDCEKKIDLDISSKVTIENKTLSCAIGKLRVKRENITYDYQRYICDEDSGEWRNEERTKEIMNHSRVFCEEEKRPAEIKQYTAGEQATYFGAIFVGSVAVVIISACAWYYYRTRKDHLSGMTKMKWWMVMSRDQRYRAAENIFYTASHASPTSTANIMQGMKLVKLLLKSETEDPEIWELAYPFLDRLHGASRRRGNRLTAVFTRYLFLEAKRIIDKHGWICPNRITPTFHQGYIRCVAIRLIFYCRFNENTEEVVKFIAEGFEKLRYNAVDQYPHCGMLWSHVATCRNQTFQKRFMKDIINFSTKNWQGKEPLEIPAADQFPKIGNVCEQAQAAVGGSLFWKAKHLPFEKLEKPLQATLGHIKGLLRSSHLDMGVILRYQFAFERRENLKKLVPAEKWEGFLDETVRILICYGQQQAAKRLENFFIYPGIENDYNQEKKARKREKKKSTNSKNSKAGAKKKKNKKASEEKEQEKAKPMKVQPATARFKKIHDAQRSFELRLADEEQALIDWLVGRVKKTPLTTNPCPLTETNQAHLNAGNEQDTKTSKSGQGTVSNVDTASKSVFATDDAFFTALLQEPTVIPRIRTCQATPEEQSRYRALLDEIFSLDTVIGVLVDFKPETVLEVTSKVMDIVKTEPALIEDIPAPITVCTDIHGQLYDLDRVFKADAGSKAGYERSNYLFCGDYVDRGLMSLEVVMALFLIKILYPDRIFLLRGNHESVVINGAKKDHTLAIEIFDRFMEKDAKRMFVAINECFCYLSVAGIIGNKIFCAHGGISTGSFTRHEMRRLKKPFHLPTDDPLIYDMLWSDPALGIKGVCYNTLRDASIIYGEDEFMHAMENIGCEAMIRGHQVLKKGYQVVWGRLFCIFTATANENTGNKGAVALVDEKLTVHIRTFKEDESRDNITWQFGQRRAQARMRRATKTKTKPLEEKTAIDDDEEEKEKMMKGRDEDEGSQSSQSDTRNDGHVDHGGKGEVAHFDDM